MRNLLPNEIDLRIGMVSPRKPKASLLLYKDSRTDMDMLDDAYGAENWQDEYREIKGVMYCGIGVRASKLDSNLPINEFVWKWNAGTQSNTEKEKGEASDAFKRAGVMWGIGRELYQWKDIWVDYSKDTDKYKKFFVTKIAYKEKTNEPKDLTIVDEEGNVMYELKGGKYKKVKTVVEPTKKETASNPTQKTEKVVTEPINDAVEEINAVVKPDVDVPNAIKKRNAGIYVELLEKVYQFGLEQDNMNEDSAKKWTEATVKNYITKELKIPFNKLELLNLDDIRLDTSKISVIINDKFMEGMMKYAEKEVYPF
jgi:hypothetical protein